MAKPVIDPPGSRHQVDGPVALLASNDDPAPLETFEAPADEAVPLRSSSDAERNEAWRTLYDAQFDRVYRLVARFGVPSAEVEDVTQQVFMVAYRRIAEVGAIGNVGGWLRGITTRVIADHHRWRRVRRVKAFMVDALYGDDATVRSTPASDAESAQVQEQVGAVLRQLSPKLRAVLVLCDIEELELAEVAENLAIPVNTVRSRRRLARESFQRLWQAQQGESHE
jgi:RNA polymerase sigma-70 factor (ECF subfamily)